MNDSNVYRVFIYQDMSKSLDFYGGLNPNDKDAAKKINKALETLYWFNVHLDAVLKKVGGAYFISESTLKSYLH